MLLFSKNIWKHFPFKKTQEVMQNAIASQNEAVLIILFAVTEEFLPQIFSPKNKSQSDYLLFQKKGNKK